MTDLARHIHIGQKIHLDLDGAIARARLAPTALDVERKPAGLITTNFGLGRRCKERADLVEYPGVGGRIRPRRATDRRLVDTHQLVQMVQPVHPDMPAWNLSSAV